MLRRGGLASAFFTLRASRSHYIGCVAAHSRYLYTVSWATALPPLILGWGGGSRLVNNSGPLIVFCSIPRQLKTEIAHLII